MKEKILYAIEGFLIGLIGHHIWNDVVLPILVAAVCAVLTAFIQHYLKRWLNTRDNKLPKFKNNGRS